MKSYSVQNICGVYACVLYEQYVPYSAVSIIHSFMCGEY
jgi:hypothetical protein